jgi:hypothetical protein
MPPHLRPRSHVPVFERPGADRTGKSTTWNFITSPVLTVQVNNQECCDQAVVHAQLSAVDCNSTTALFLLYRRKRRHNRLHWLHQIIQKKEEFNAFYTLFGELGDDANKFFLNYFRMSVSSFDKMHHH